MTFLPIVERELRVQCRRRGLYLNRMMAVLIATVITTLIILSGGQSHPREISSSIFITLTVLLFIHAIGTGGHLTSDCLSEEKREGTLGLLFLTDLRGYDIVLGKLASNSLNAFYSMFAIFPILAIPILLGGVTYGEFSRVVLTAMGLLFFSLSVGMFCSALCREESRARSLPFLVLVAFCTAPPLLGWILHHRDPVIPAPFFVSSPAYAAFTAIDSEYLGHHGEFWSSLVLTQSYSWLLLALASRIVPHAWQDRAVSRGPRSMGASPSTDVPRRRHLLHINPVLWLSSRRRSQALYPWIFLGIIAVLWAWGAWKFKADFLDKPIYVLTALILHTGFKFWIASDASRRFVEDRKSGALELLLSTPITVEDILRGQRLALFRHFSGPAAVVVAADLIFLLTGADDALWVLIWLAGISIFIMDLYALSWVSMWMGLRSMQLGRASSAAVARILFLPWGIFYFGFFVFGIFSWLSRYSEFDAKGVTIFWWVICLIVDLAYIRSSRERLLLEFRQIATERFTPVPKRFGWFTRRNPELASPSP